MNAVETDRTPTAVAINASIETILGQERYLEKITDSLYAKGVRYVHQLIALSEPEFGALVGRRVTDENVKRVKERLRALGLSFRHLD